MQRSEEYFSNAAAELSKRLTDGKPCPVAAASIITPASARATAAPGTLYSGSKRAYKEAREAQDKASAAAQGALSAKMLLRQRDAARLRQKSSLTMRRQSTARSRV